MLNSQQIDTYSALADLLIPDAGGMPSATQAHVHSEWINVALGHRPDLMDHFLRAINACHGKDVSEAVETLNREDTQAFDALGVLTSGAYFLNPEVKAKLGCPGQLPVPAQEDTETYLDMLENVVDRGAVYRASMDR